MLSILILLILNSIAVHSAYIYDDDEGSNKNSRSGFLDDNDFEPVTVANKGAKIVVPAKNTDCDQFSKFAVNCTIQAAKIYNSSKKSPPMPGKIFEWCSAIRHLTNCAIDWNSECTEFTDKRFNEESIKGHMHVVNNVCDDDLFLTRYDEVPSCIEKSEAVWEACYNTFLNQVNSLKNGTQQWSHYATHFKLCCIRTRFRRCTLDALFDHPIYKCPMDQAVTLQKFSVVVSEGDVYQDCDHNMMYSNCPGGDPRPSGLVLAKLMDADFASGTPTYPAVHSASTVFIKSPAIFFVFIQCFMLIPYFDFISQC